MAAAAGRCLHACTLMSVLPRVPILDLAPETEALWDELNTALQRVLRSGHFILGQEVSEFEREVAAYLGVEHAVGLNSGTDALVIALRALGVGAGDEVITSPFTFFATVESILQVGARPVFVDINASTFNLDVDLIEEMITERTVAILPVHLYGQAADMEPLLRLAKERSLTVLEDAAQAFGGEYNGRKVGTLGDAGAFSFFPSKNLGAFGDAGLLATDRAEIADAARVLRSHGARRKYYNELTGYNSRLDAVQAAVLRAKLRHVDVANRGRQRAARTYDELLLGQTDVVTPVVAPYAGHVFHQYTIRLPPARRDEVASKLEQEGIETKVYYPLPVHRMPPCADQRRDLPVAEAAADEVLSLPLWPQIEPATQQRVAEALRRAL